MGKPRGRASVSSHVDAEHSDDASHASFVSTPTSEFVPVAAAGEESKLLANTMESNVGPLINLVDQLRALGVEKDIAIPQIAVMGDQSSGKSSVLEAVSGIPFPRGSGLVTKCATELRMKKAPAGTAMTASVKLSWTQEQPSMAGSVDTYDAISKKIEELTEVMLLARGTNATFESEHSIVIDLVAPTVPDLTVVDLPGIVRTSTEGQSDNVRDEVDSLLDRYLKQERTIILCVIPSSVDIACVDILERANDVDPDGVRTIGVLTKPDTIGEGNEDEVVQTVQGLRKPLKLGYLMVKNRSQKQIEDGLTLAEARNLEKTFFSKHPYFGSVDASFFGVENLMCRLTSVLVTRIQAGLPYMRKEIAQMKETTVEELRTMGKAPPTEASEVHESMIKISQSATALISEAVKGDYSKPFFNSSGLRMMAQIRRVDGPHDCFRKAVLDCNPQEKWEVDSLRAEIASMRGRELPGFLNWNVFDMLLKDAVRLWKEPALKLLEAVKAIVEDVCDKAIESTVPQYRSLSAGMKQIVQTEVDTRAYFVRTTIIEQWLSVESDAFTLQKEFFELYNKKKVERFQEAFDEMQPTLAKDWGDESTTEHEQARQKMTEWYKSTHSVGDRSNERHEAEDMKMLLESYWKTAVDRAIDSMCMKVDQHMIRGLDEKILKSFIKLSTDATKCAAFFSQDPRTKEKRLSLEARLDRLKKAQDLITMSAGL